MSNEKKPFKRKKRSPFGLVEDVLGAVETSSKSVAQETGDKKNDEVTEVRTELLSKNEEAVKTSATNLPLVTKAEGQELNLSLKPEATKPKKERSLFKQYESRFNLHSKQEALSEGFLMLPNLLVMEIMHAKLGVNEYQVLLAIFRLTVGFQKESESISIGVISDMTGIKTRSRISKALNGLESRGFITRVSGGVDCPSVLGISVHYTRQLNLVHKEPTIVPSDNFLDGELKKLKSSSKRKSEQDFLLALRKRFSEKIITECYSYVMENGDLKNGANVHSPFRYLDQAIERIAEIVSSSKAADTLRETRIRATERLKKEQASREASREAISQKIIQKIDLGLKEAFSEDELEKVVSARYAREIKKNTSLSGIPKSIMSLKLKRDLAVEKQIVSREEVDQI